MSARSIHLSGFRHGDQPIPAACRVGPLLMTGGVHGMDRETGQVPPDLESQVRNMFANLSGILHEAGGSLADVAKVTIFAGVPEARAAVNVAWLLAFPDPERRPARHTLTYHHLPKPMLVQCDATAFILEARPGS